MLCIHCNRQDGALRTEVGARVPYPTGFRLQQGGDGVRAGRGGLGVFVARCDLADGAHAQAHGEGAASLRHREARGTQQVAQRKEERVLLVPEPTPDATR